MIYNDSMVQPQQQGMRQQYGDSILAFTPFSMKKTGLIQGQTILKLDKYDISCIPYQLSMKKCVVLATLSQNELLLFQKLKEGLASLTLVFQRDGRPAPMKIFFRCTIQQMGMMKGKDNLSLIALEIKNCPADLAAIIADYMALMDRLRLQFDDYKAKQIQITPQSSKLLEYNDYATVQFGAEQSRVQLFSLSTAKAEFLVPHGKALPAPGSPCPLKLYFQKYQFTAAGKIASAVALPSGVGKVSLDIDFVPELVEIVDYFYFKSRVAQRSRDSADSK